MLPTILWLLEVLAILLVLLILAGRYAARRLGHSQRVANGVRPAAKRPGRTGPGPVKGAVVHHPVDGYG